MKVANTTNRMQFKRTAAHPGECPQDMSAAYFPSRHPQPRRLAKHVIVAKITYNCLETDSYQISQREKRPIGFIIE